MAQPPSRGRMGGMSLSPPMPWQPLPGQRLAGRDAGHDDALGSRRGHGFEGTSPELLEELLLALLHAGHGPRRSRCPPPVPPLSAVLSATSPARPRSAPLPAARPGAAPVAGSCAVPNRLRLPFCAGEAGIGAGLGRRPLPGAASRSCRRRSRGEPGTARLGAAGGALTRSRGCPGGRRAAPEGTRWLGSPIACGIHELPRRSPGTRRLQVGPGGSHPKGRFTTLTHRPSPPGVLAVPRTLLSPSPSLLLPACCWVTGTPTPCPLQGTASAWDPTRPHPLAPANSSLCVCPLPTIYQTQVKKEGEPRATSSDGQGRKQQEAMETAL